MSAVTLAAVLGLWIAVPVALVGGLTALVYHGGQK